MGSTNAMRRPDFEAWAPITLRKEYDRSVIDPLGTPPPAGRGLRPRTTTRGLDGSKPTVLRESKVTVKIPRPLYRKIQAVVEGSGFNSPTDFIVYVLRDLMGEADDPAKAEPKSEYTKEELEDLKRKLKNLGYL